MSKNRKNPAATPGAANYEVGYAQPPQSTRFKKGVSGNPRGRPKGAKNKRPGASEERMKALIIEEAYRTVTMREGVKTVSVPIAQAVIRALGVKAVKGDHRSQRLFAELLGQTESANRLQHNEALDVAMTYKTEWEDELERRAALGITGPEPLPHPDDVQIDMRTGEVWIIGPVTKEEKARLDRLTKSKASFEGEVRWLRDELASDPNHPHKEMMERDLKQSEHILSNIRRVLPD